MVYGSYGFQGWGWPGGPYYWGSQPSFGGFCGYGPPVWGYPNPMMGGPVTAGWANPWSTWGGTWAPPSTFIGGLGGLRRHGGEYTPQFRATGLPTDEEIAEMIYDTIDMDPLVPPDADINVEVSAGTVTLTGTVPNKSAKHAVGDDAWWAPGVVDVMNNLTVTGRRRVRQAPTEGQGHEGGRARQRARRVG